MSNPLPQQPRQSDGFDEFMKELIKSIPPENPIFEEEDEVLETEHQDVLTTVEE